MRTEDCLDILAALLAAASIPAREATPLYRSADAVLVMARAYESDGRTFLAAGDPVNALASAWYGSGWFHLGVTSGLLETGTHARCPFRDPCETLPQSCSEKLREKTGRYEQLLSTARASVRPAGEPGTAAGAFSEKVLFIAALYSVRGTRLLGNGTYEDALAAFSYAHGWLDAGVAAGLFAVTARHDLFPV